MNWQAYLEVSANICVLSFAVWVLILNIKTIIKFMFGDDADERKLKL